MSNPVPVISQLYLQFNQTFEAARMDNSPTEFPKYLDKLFSLQSAIEIQTKKATALPEKITSAELLSKELSAKIEMLFNKDVKKTPPAPPNPLSLPLLNCVGFGNAGANCWVNSLLQFIRNNPVLLQIWNNLADFYAGGGNLDTPRVDAVIAHFHGGPVSTDRFNAGENLFIKITSPYQRLAAIDQLIKDGRAAIADRLLPHLSDAYTEALKKLATVKPFAEAIQLLIKSETPKEQAHLAGLRQVGKHLRDAMTIYNQTIDTAQITGQPPRPISNTISQNVRLAFSFLFGTFNPITGVRVFSPSSFAHEDAHEAMQVFMGRAEEVSRAQGHPPANYYFLETRRTYQPTTDAPEAINPNFPRDALENGNTSSKRDLDYQLVLQPSATNDRPLETLLAGYFRSPAAPGTEPAYYLSANNPFLQQKYRLVEEQRYFVGDVPQTLTMVIKRFGSDLTGHPYKIHTRVMANRLITMPASAMAANDHDRAFELSSFICHIGGAGGGHYVSYKKLPEGWVECNDSRVRRMSDLEIDATLHGATPYVLDYRLVPAPQQAAMLQLAAELRARGPIRPPAPPQALTPPSKELALHQTIIDQLVKLEQLLQKPTSTNKEIMEALQCLNTLAPLCLPLFCKMTALHNGKVREDEGIQLLYSNPKLLASIKTSWIRNSSEDIVGQLIRSEREKYAIRKCEHELNALKTAASKTGASKEQVAALAKKKQEYDQMVFKFSLENLRTFHGLLKNLKLGNDQIKTIFQQELDIPEEWQKLVYARIEKMTGKPGKEQFEANPRILLAAPSLDILEEIIKSLK